MYRKLKRFYHNPRVGGSSPSSATISQVKICNYISALRPVITSMWFLSILLIHAVLSKSVWLRCDRRVTKVDRVGPMLEGKTPPVGLDKHRLQKRGLKGWVLLTVVYATYATNLSKLAVFPNHI